MTLPTRRNTTIGVVLMSVALTSCAASPDAPTSSPTDDAASAPAAPAASPGAEPSAAGDYCDGRYSATGWYGSLPSHQDVTLTIRGTARENT